MVVPGNTPSEGSPQPSEIPRHRARSRSSWRSISGAGRRLSCVQELIADRGQDRTAASTWAAMVRNQHLCATRNVRRHNAILLEYMDTSSTAAQKTDLCFT